MFSVFPFCRASSSFRGGPEFDVGISRLKGKSSFLWILSVFSVYFTELESFVFPKEKGTPHKSGCNGNRDQIVWESETSDVERCCRPIGSSSFTGRSPLLCHDDDPAVGLPLLDPRAWEDQERERFDFQRPALFYKRMYFIEWTKNPKEQTSGLKEYDSSGPQRTAPSERQ